MVSMRHSLSLSPSFSLSLLRAFSLSLLSLKSERGSGRHAPRWGGYFTKAVSERGAMRTLHGLCAPKVSEQDLESGHAGRNFVIDNLLVHFINEMTWWTGLAPWEFEISFSGSLTSTLQKDCTLYLTQVCSYGECLSRPYRGTPPTRKRPPHEDPPRTLGIGLRKGPKGVSVFLRVRYSCTESIGAGPSEKW